MRCALCLSLSLALAAALGCGKVTESGGGVGADAGDVDRVSCDTDADCPLSQPVCDLGVGLCRGCEATSECSERLGNEQCELGSGACVSCTEDPHCPTAGAPFCDEESFICRGCVNNDECMSGLCDVERATCATPSDIVWVDNSTNNMLPACGPRATPCGNLADGFAKVGDVTPASQPPRRYVVILPGTSPYGGGNFVPPDDTYVFADGADFDGTFTARIGVPNVVWVGGNFDGVTIPAAAQSNPFNCSDGQLRLIGVSVNAYTDGVFSTDGGCELEVYASTFTANGTGISNRNMAGTILEGNYFTDNEGHAVNVSGPNGSIRSNLFVANGVINKRSTISTTQGVGQTMRISYNTFFGNDTDGSGVVVCGASGGAPIQVIASNIAVSNDASISGCAPATIVNNLLDLLDGDPLLSTNSNQPPLFVDADNGDFHLQPSSPAIDQGGLLNAPPFDLDGKPRPSGAGPDIGAYERE